MEPTFVLGEWIKWRRRALDLTQAALADRIGCAPITVRKIEADERRPSRQIAERLADVFQLAPDERTAFLRVVRSELSIDQLPMPPASSVSPWLPAPSAHFSSPVSALAPAASSDGIASQPAGENGGNSTGTLRQPLSTLPIFPTSFIGRTQEIAQVQALLMQYRLVTVLGLGGIGKTRLSVEAARSLAPQFSDGLVFVSLVGISDPQLVLPGVAQSLGLSIDGQQPLAERLLRYLREKRLLLLLDNCEHVLEAVVQVITLLEAARHVVILTTSRERLNLWAETIVVLEGLVYHQEGGMGQETEGGYEAERLFVARAQGVDQGFAMTGANQGAIAQICRLVQGMPLAIELAASWVWTFPCSEIAVGLSASLDFLETELRNIPERHRDVRGVFGYSWRLLKEPEREGFRRLAVFRGGFSRESAVAVGVLPRALAGLQEKSLIRRLPADRYEIHELLRQYGAEQLAQHPIEQQQAQEQHARYFLELAERGAHELRDGDQAAWRARLEQELDNFCAALAWVGEQQQVGLVLRLSTALWPLWDRLGYVREAEGWLAEALRLAEAAPQQDQLLLARCQQTLGVTYTRQGRYADAWAMLEQAGASFTTLDDQQHMVIQCGLLGLIRFLQGMQDEAQQYFERQRELATNLGNRYELRQALKHLGMNASIQGRYAQAAVWFEQALALEPHGGADMLSGQLLGWLGCVYQRCGAYDRAIQAFTDAIGLLDRRGGCFDLCNTIGDLGVTYALQGAHTQAQACFQCALELALESGVAVMTGWMLYWVATSLAEMGNSIVANTLYTRAIALLRAISSPYFLSNALAHQAEFLMHQEQLTEALTCTQETLALIQQHGLGLPIGVAWPQLLLVRLEVMLGKQTVATAAHMLQELRAHWPAEEQQAEIAYTLWCLDPARESDREHASALCAALFDRTPNVRYCRWYQHLTGQPLPLPQLPELPPIVLQQSKPLADILAQVRKAEG